MTRTIQLLPPKQPVQRLNAVLTIAGSDSSGGAGIEADIKTILAHKAYALTCITALTAQNTSGVGAVAETAKSQVEESLQKNFDDFVEGYDEPLLKVVKTGVLMQSSLEALAGYLPYLAQKNIRLVVDPVMVATLGKQLTPAATLGLCLQNLIPRAELCTPNFVEAAHLWAACGGDPKELDVGSVLDLVQFASKLQAKLRCRCLLVKGGHVPFQNETRVSDPAQTSEQLQIVDVLVEEGREPVLFRSQFVHTKNTHGTGCTLASAIAANLANGHQMAEAVALAISYVHRAMAAAGGLGHGHGALNHVVAPPRHFIDVVQGKRWVLPGSFFHHLKTHPLVAASWQRYTEHPFLAALARNELPWARFLYYLKQDYFYLMDYARVHGAAACKAPTFEQIEAQTLIIANVTKEAALHKLVLSEQYGIEYLASTNDPELKPGPACLAYTQYLHKISAEQDFLAIKVAVAPCLHGYAEAGTYALAIRAQHSGLGVLASEKESDAYTAWIAVYVSDWYRLAHEDGQRVLDQLLALEPVSEQRMEELCLMFRDVVDLEVAFWDEVLEQ